MKKYLDKKMPIGDRQRLKNIIADLRKTGESETCPYWENVDHHINFPCGICGQLFPRSFGINNSCPCHEYTPKYLIQRLNEILKHDKQKESKS